MNTDFKIDSRSNEQTKERNRYDDYVSVTVRSRLQRSRSNSRRSISIIVTRSLRAQERFDDSTFSSSFSVHAVSPRFFFVTRETREPGNRISKSRHCSTRLQRRSSLADCVAQPSLSFDQLDKERNERNGDRPITHEFKVPPI